jgi:hypothetical protein
LDDLSSLVGYTVSYGCVSRSFNLESTSSRVLISNGSNKSNNDYYKYACPRADIRETTTICVECFYYSLVAIAILAGIGWCYYDVAYG